MDQQIQAMGHLPVSVIQELEMEKMAAQLHAAAAGAMLTVQANLGAVFLTSPGDNKAVRIRQAITGLNSKPIEVETFIELL